MNGASGNDIFSSLIFGVCLCDKDMVISFKKQKKFEQSMKVIHCSDGERTTYSKRCRVVTLLVYCLMTLIVCTVSLVLSVSK
jgi:hypothetical protein